MPNRPFIHDDFLLDTPAARRLYHEHTAGLPIIDYHCHLPPREIAEDRRWENLAEVWLGDDHYKWRALRTNGVAERYCTGDATDREKFAAYAAAMPDLLRNPLYHWSHLELARCFGITDLLSPATADTIWDRANAVLRGGLGARECLRRFKVEVVCTTDDPTDDLRWHRALRAERGLPFKVLPTWRPDAALAIDDVAAWNGWLDRLAAAAELPVSTYDELLAALAKRHAFFAASGCRLSDYGLATVPFAAGGARAIGRTFAAARAGTAPAPAAALRFRSALLLELARLDHAAGWARQLHIGALRNNNRRMLAAVGPNRGFDSIGDAAYATPLAHHLDTLDATGQLGRTIFYNLHPKDFAMLAAMAGNFQDGIVPGKIQLGSGWWFLDQLDGMTQQLEAVSQMGLLARFVGMLTDSRSFLSFPRHEYFRRLLCRILGREMETGLIPDDDALVAPLVRNVCHGNARAYFRF